jgi:hypothetical protein
MMARIAGICSESSISRCHFLIDYLREGKIKIPPIAATCDNDDLAGWGGNAGAVPFERSRAVPQPSASNVHAAGKKIILATGTT